MKSVLKLIVTVKFVSRLVLTFAFPAGSVTYYPLLKMLIPFPQFTGVRWPMTTQKRILAIDDNEELLAGLKTYFSKKSFDVVAAPDGLEGLKLLEAERGNFDIVITDIVMPNVSGVGIIAIFKNRYPEIPVIAITGMGEHPETLAREAHADMVVVKPFDLPDLDQRIASLVKRP
jgi:CheY-like chemotaxis protein